MIKGSRRFFQHKERKDKRYLSLNGFLTRKKKKMMKKENTLRCPHRVSSSRPLAHWASVHHTVLYMHYVFSGKHLAVVLDTAGSSAPKHPLFQVQWPTATLIYLQRSFFVCSISFICSIHLLFATLVFICSVLFFICSVLFLFAAYFFICRVLFLFAAFLFVCSVLFLFPAYIFYLQRSFFVCSVSFLFAVYFFICSVPFLFAAFLFYLQCTFFICSVPFLFAAFLFCLQRVPCGPSYIARCS